MKSINWGTIDKEKHASKLRADLKKPLSQRHKRGRVGNHSFAGKVSSKHVKHLGDGCSEIKAIQHD